MSSSDRQNTPPWTYQTDISLSGQGQQPAAPMPSEPVALLQTMAALQNQTLELQRQILEAQRQQLELVRESTQVAREQRARQAAELERWQSSHGETLETCKQTLGQLEQVHASLLRDLSDYVAEYHENLVDGDFALTEFVDRFGPRLAHLNTMLAVLRPLAAAQQNRQNQQQQQQKKKGR